MKKLFCGIFVFSCFFISCETIPAPTTENPYRPISNIPNAIALDGVRVEFESTLIEGYKTNELNELAYTLLLEAAKERISGIIDVANIEWEYTDMDFLGIYYDYTAKGTIITTDTETATSFYRDTYLDADILYADFKDFFTSIFNRPVNPKGKIYNINAKRDNLNDEVILSDRRNRWAYFQTSDKKFHTIIIRDFDILARQNRLEYIGILEVTIKDDDTGGKITLPFLYFQEL